MYDDNMYSVYRTIKGSAIPRQREASGLSLYQAEDMVNNFNSYGYMEVEVVLEDPSFQPDYLRQ
jgi:hypothetical protein